ncbi:hypothetical protein A7A76_23340 [Lysobacter enzymogenes]|uniref:XVIPCD domain-containing protein n=1 Tax=Lysobacter enzymogenes TaxID=69 RepID=UPI0019D03808|nr:XVIPCD domain-containing protein [Lysobacter enzymogenes]MBN7137637.1 hypothetical protein [Lysobacter enzymogenes]
MAQPNAQLRSAIDRFSAQSGVTGDQTAQLRGAFAADAGLLTRFNQLASAGQLNGFAIQAPGGPKNSAGTYDLQAGVVTLPAACFQSTGGIPTADLSATLHVQEMAVRFAHTPYKDEAGRQQAVTQGMLDNLQSSINSAPVLSQQIKAAATAHPHPHLQNFAISPPEAGLGGSYHGATKTMSLPASILQSDASGQIDRNNLTFTLGHEIQHGFNYASYVRSAADFDREVSRIAQDSNPVNDYTAAIGSRIQAARENEAKSHIGGWNALLSRQQENGPVTLADMYASSMRSRDFVEYDATTKQFSPKAGLTFNSDLTLSETPANVAAMGRLYFDKFPKGYPGVPVERTSTLGPHREADNINFSGMSAISRAITLDRTYAHPVNGVAPQMHIDMRQLRLDERLIERLGLDINVRPEERQAYYDTSQSPPVLKHFDHTKSGPSLNQHVPLEPGVQPSEAASSGRAVPSSPGHPDHALYSQIAGHVKQHDQTQGRTHAAASERLTASLLALAKDGGLARVDHVVFSAKHAHVAAGENVFVVQGRLDDPANLRVHMKTDDAVRMPVEASFAKVEAINERLVQQVDMAQQPGQVQSEQSKGPTLGGR